MYKRDVFHSYVNLWRHQSLQLATDACRSLKNQRSWHEFQDIFVGDRDSCVYLVLDIGFIITFGDQNTFRRYLATLSNSKIFQVALGWKSLVAEGASDSLQPIEKFHRAAEVCHSALSHGGIRHCKGCPHHQHPRPRRPVSHPGPWRNKLWLTSCSRVCHSLQDDYYRNDVHSYLNIRRM